MGKGAKDDEKPESAESSGYADIMDIAADLGSAPGRDTGGYGITRASVEEEDDDDMHNIASGYGGMAAASLVEHVGSGPVSVEAANVPSPASSASVRATAAPAARKPKPVSKPQPTPSSSGSHSSPGAALLSGPISAEVSRPSMTATPVTPQPRREEGKSGAMVWLLMLGAAAVVGLAFFFLGFNEDQTAQRTTPSKVRAAGSAAEQPKQTPPPKPKPKPLPAVVQEEPEPEEPEPEEPEPEEPEPEEIVEVEAKAGARAGKRRSKGAKGAKVAKAEAEQPEEPAEPEPKAEDPKTATPDPLSKPKKGDGGKFSSECLLNPNRPGCEGAKTGGGGPAAKDLDKALADKLTESQIRKGLSKHKGKAKACGAKHGADAGIKVRVKISIAGASGKITSINPIGEFAGKPVGKCVADALRKATFPRFKSPSQGATYPVSM